MVVKNAVLFGVMLPIILLLRQLQQGFGCSALGVACVFLLRQVYKKMNKIGTFASVYRV